jgi:hypothetical protein
MNERERLLHILQASAGEIARSLDELTSADPSSFETRLARASALTLADQLRALLGQRTDDGEPALCTA